METYTVKVHEDGARWWYKNGLLHRTDGPAIELANGDRYWYKNGQRHRLDGPAVEMADGHRAWWQNGQRHRVDGPAFEWANGHREWWINGVQLTEEQFNQQTKKTTCENKTVVIDGIKYKLVKE